MIFVTVATQIKFLPGCFSFCAAADIFFIYSFDDASSKDCCVLLNNSVSGITLPPIMRHLAEG